MKYSFIVLFCLLIAACVATLKAAEESDAINFNVTRSDYTFSTVFDMTSEKQNFGSIVKSIFHISTHYDSYDRYGLYEGQGICRMVTLGLIYSWATEIDIYNKQGIRIGMIDGQVMSAEPAKFSFYDAADNRLCIAYLDLNCMSFVLVDPENTSFVLARLTRNFILDTVDNWDIALYHPEKMPLKFIKIFAAFACDTQDSFKRDL